MKEKKEKPSRLIKILILIIGILLVLIAYAFVVKPIVNGMVVDAYTKGIEYAVTEISQRASECQQVPLIVGDKTTNIIDLSCLQVQS